MEDSVILEHLMRTYSTAERAEQTARMAHQRLDTGEGYFKEIQADLKIVIEFMHQTKARAAVWAVVFAGIGGIIGAVVSGTILHFMTK